MCIPIERGAHPDIEPTHSNTNTHTIRYAGRGVSSTKGDVHRAIKKIDKGLYPRAFCKVIPDVLTNDPEYAIVMHADGTYGLRFLVTDGAGFGLDRGRCMCVSRGMGPGISKGGASD